MLDRNIKNRAIMDQVKAFPEGLSVGVLDQLLPAIPRRTLQRRLGLLLKDGQIRSEGEGRGRKYFPIHSVHGYKDFKVKEDRPTYKDSHRSIRQELAKPVSQRLPVSYKKDFLANYRPGIDFYLSEAERASLLRMGQIEKEDQAAGTYLNQILDRLLIDLSWNSSRLEGNTYSLLDTERLIQFGEQASEKEGKEAQMILNHKAAIEMLADQAQEIGFNSYTICNLHALLADNLLLDGTAAGRPRQRGVQISGSVYYPLQIPQSIEEQFLLLLEKASAIPDAFEQSLFVMIHLPYLQAFEDVNKRVSRLAANIPMVKRNLCPLSFADVDRQEYVTALLAIYELNEVGLMKDLYMQAYARSSQKYVAVRESLGEPDMFNLRYRTELKVLVRELVLRFEDADRILKTLPALGIDIPEEHRDLFMSRVRDELSSLHMGNIARYRLKPAEFERWAEG